MKKLSLSFLFLFVTSVGYSQVPTTDAPVPPVRAAVDFKSIFSDSGAYSNLPGVNLNPNWGQTGFGTANTSFDLGSGNLMIQYANHNYQGIDWAGTPQNVSGMEFVHIDVWTNNTNLGVSLISPGAENAYVIANVPGTWQSIDIPMSAFTVPNLNNIIQFKFDGGTGGTIYLDNLYFWKAPLAAGSDATLSDLRVDGVTVNGFVSASVNYAVELVVGTTTVPQITATLNDSAATITSITQAPAIPGNATVLVTSQNGNVTKTYTVSFAATKPNASPTPPTYTSHLAIIADITDTGTFSNFWEPNDFFGAAPTRLDLDPSATVNKAARLNLSVGWGGGQTATGLLTTNVSAYNAVHFDYFIPSSVAAGQNGHQFYLDLISRTANANTEAFYGIGTAIGGSGTGIVDEVIVFDSWQGVDIPMSTFVGKGFNPANFFQFKIGAQSDIRTQLGYFDNIYFYDSATLSNSSVINAATFSVYPNPATDSWNFTSTDTVVTSVQVYDLSGKLVIDQKANSTNVTIDASILSNGVYIAKVFSAEGTQNMKLIKQ